MKRKMGKKGGDIEFVFLSSLGEDYSRFVYFNVSTGF